MSRMSGIENLYLAVFGGLQSLCTSLLILGLFVTGHYLGDGGRFWLYQIAGSALGVKVLLVEMRMRLRHRQTATSE